MKKAVLIGSGIMSTTLAVLLKKLDPSIDIQVLEMLDEPAEESSASMNNAGTGHAGYCELNYTPEKDGSVDISKAVKIAQEFMYSREFWAYLVQEGYIKDPKSFIRTTPHYSFVTNQKDIDFLKSRYEKMKSNPLFKDMEFTQDPEVINSWIPLVMKGRDSKTPVACTRMIHGTDVDFGNLTKEVLINLIKKQEVNLHCSHMVKSFKKRDNGQWSIRAEDLKTKEVKRFIADFVFIGAGGGSILLLEKTNIPEAQGYGGFPVGGEWLVCENPAVVNQHHAKVYGQASLGAPPMSVPHLDTRVINGQNKLLFGPFATFSTKFLKHGSYLDFFHSLQTQNIGFISQAGLKNMSLTKYLLSQVSQVKSNKIAELRKYFPEANDVDWKEYQAGQRVQLIKKDLLKGGVLEFGTEVVVSQDGTMSAMLGASPGASTSVSIILEVIQRCFKMEFKDSNWTNSIAQFIPSFNKNLSDPQVVENSLINTNKILKLEEK